MGLNWWWWWWLLDYFPSNNKKKKEKKKRPDSQRRKQIEITLKAVSTNTGVQINWLNFVGGEKVFFHEIAQNPYSHSYVTVVKNFTGKNLHEPFGTTYRTYSFHAVELK